MSSVKNHRYADQGQIDAVYKCLSSAFGIHRAAFAGPTLDGQGILRAGQYDNTLYILEPGKKNECLLRTFNVSQQGHAAWKLFRITPSSFFQYTVLSMRTDRNNPWIPVNTEVAEELIADLTQLSHIMPPSAGAQ